MCRGYEESGTCSARNLVSQKCLLGEDIGGQDGEVFIQEMLHLGLKDTRVPDSQTAGCNTHVWDVSTQTKIYTADASDSSRVKSSLWRVQGGAETRLGRLLGSVKLDSRPSDTFCSWGHPEQIRTLRGRRATSQAVADCRHTRAPERGQEQEQGPELLRSVPHNNPKNIEKGK